VRRPATTPLVLALAALAGCALLGPGPKPPVIPDVPALAMRGHRHTVTSLVVAPDGSRVVSGSRDGTARLWRLPSGAAERVLVHTRWFLSLWAVATSPDGRLVASAADDTKIRIWEATTGVERVVLSGHAHSIRALAWSSDGRWLASGSRDGTVRVWEAGGWIPRAVLAHGNTVRSLAFSADGGTLYTGSAEDLIRAWDVKTWTLRGATRAHANTVHALAVARDGGTLVSGSADHTIRVWWFPAMAPRAVLTLDRGAEPPTVNERRGRYPGPEVLALALTPDGRFAASTHRGSAIRLWDLAALRQVGEIRSPADTSYAVAFAEDAATLFTGGDDRVVYGWDVGRITGGVTARSDRGHAPCASC
jgi:WD40 repeat protein